MDGLWISLEALERDRALEHRGAQKAGGSGFRAGGRRALMEFHILKEVRQAYSLDKSLFSLRGNVVLADLRQVRDLAAQFNAKLPAEAKPIQAGQLYAMGLIDEILHYVVALYREQVQGDVFETALQRLAGKLGEHKTGSLLHTFGEQFPPQAVYAGNATVEDYLAGSDAGESCRALALEELMLLALANLNPGFSPFLFLFDDQRLEERTIYPDAIEELKAHFADLPPFGPDGMSLWDMLRAPALASPDSLTGQLEYMRKHWGLLIRKFMARILTGLDVIKEEEKPSFFGPGPSEAYTYGWLENEYERFSPDQDWMPKTVLVAKSTLVWLYQLSQKYRREIIRLDQIPDEELDELARRGFTGLWLIGLWERSQASRTIKQWTGNPDAAASAYSLHDYDIAGELGGWGSLANLRDRCFRRGIRLGSDMVPNHTGIDSRWIVEHPDRFLQLPYPPFPTYNYNCGNLSGREDVTVQIEEHYFTRSDAAVVFKRIDNRSGETRYIYHGNDGTSMPWNDTAQIDFLNPEAREAVIRTIIGVCKQFSIVRFDAAMTLAKRHIQRLWYPEPGRGGDIASRAEHAISMEEFNRRIPNEFWREVVDRCAVEAPNTLLLAEAFWMMEGYFVRTLGMHRVYNSAFMNMLKNEDNAKYRATVKNTLEFDPEILKRFVNFMNNPDEETASAQFGKGDKYFGICTLLVTMPGLPMFGHGQIEGFEEKYGMEYRRAYRDEQPDGSLVDRHEREIFPLMKKRALFSGSADFNLYDFYAPDGSVNENVFAYSNRAGHERSLVLYNNAYAQAAGWIHRGSTAIPQKDGGYRQDSLCQALLLHNELGYFALLREQRTNRWYIRSSRELAERGLFVSLDGYGAQVFLDIHEIADTAQGRWGILCGELNGRGVPDIHAAFQDLFLGELYSRLAALLTGDTAGDFARLLSGETGGEGTAAAAAAADPQALIAGLRQPALEFIAAAQRYLDGAEGKYDPFTARKGRPALQAEAVWEEFAAFLGRLAALRGLGTKPGKAGRRLLGQWFPASPKAGASGRAAHPGLDVRRSAAYALGYGALALLRPVLGKGATGAEAKALADHWRFDRKLIEFYGALGIPREESCRVTELMKAVLARTAPEAALARRAALTAESLVLDNYYTGDFKAVLGVNSFEDVTWFNKEAFGLALLYGPFFLGLEGGGAFTGEGKAESEKAWLARFEAVADMAGRFAAAEAESGYRLDRLLDALSPDQAKEKKPGAKAKKGD